MEILWGGCQTIFEVFWNISQWKAIRLLFFHPPWNTSTYTVSPWLFSFWVGSCNQRQLQVSISGGHQQRLVAVRTQERVSLSPLGLGIAVPSLSNKTHMAFLKMGDREIPKYSQVRIGFISNFTKMVKWLEFFGVPPILGTQPLNPIETHDVMMWQTQQ